MLVNTQMYLKLKKKKKRTNCSEGKSEASEEEERNKTLLAQHLVFQINYKTIKKKNTIYAPKK